MPSSTQLQIRIDQALKQDAEEIFKEMGLSISQAVKLFLKQVILKKEIPFKIKAEHSDKYIKPGSPMRIEELEKRVRFAIKENAEGKSILDEDFKIEI